jgi:colanic acid biosynthesis protein WcaH
LSGEFLTEKSIKKLIDLLESLINNPSEGLPEELFLFVSRITPMINVDLLIQKYGKGTLLTWRDDSIYLSGWHIPGGIIRYKETISDRIQAVAAGELGATVEFKKEPLAINEVIHPSRKIRGHFISLLYECTLASPLNEKLRYKKGTPQPGQWTWHNKCPDNIIPIHEMYRKYF